MAAEVVGSAVAQEAVSLFLSSVKERYEEMSDAKERVERLEMAHIKLEAAVETSHRWNVTSAPLLRWRSTLKRAAQECDHTLRRCKQRLQEEEGRQHEVIGSSLPTRIARAARSLVSSIFNRGGGDDDEPRPSTVRRFERFAEGAREFLTHVELGGSPRRRVSFFNPLARRLLAGEGTKLCLVRGGEHLSLILQPFSWTEHEGMMAASLIFLLEDADAPEKNFLLALSLRLSESTDVVGVAVVRSLQLFPADLSSTAEAVKAKLTQLPTQQDLRWLPDTHFVYGLSKHRGDLLAGFEKWFWPEPLCCQRQDNPVDDLHPTVGSTRSSTAEAQAQARPPPSPCDAHLEAVTQVYLLGHVALSDRNDYDRQRRDFRHLKLGGHFWPHHSSQDLPAAVGGSATEMTNWDATRRRLYANIRYEELGETLLPKAVDCLRGDAAATSYQMLWRSGHGGAYIQAEKSSCRWRAATRKEDKGGKPRRKQGPGKKVPAWTSGINEFMSSWIVHAPAQLQASAVDWIQKQEQLPLPLILKANSCVHDCPITLLSLLDRRALARRIEWFSKSVASTNSRYCQR